MKRFAAVLFASSVAAGALLSSSAGAQTPQPNPSNAANPNDPAVKAATEAGGEAAQRWLALLDAGQLDACYDALAPAVQRQVGKADFAASLDAVRKQYGTAKARRASKVTFTHSMPGAPEGDYVVLQYETDFAGGAHGVETVVPMRTADGWKVSGYFVR